MNAYCLSIRKNHNRNAKLINVSNQLIPIIQTKIIIISTGTVNRNVNANTISYTVHNSITRSIPIGKNIENEPQYHNAKI